MVLFGYFLISLILLPFLIVFLIFGLVGIYAMTVLPIEIIIRSLKDNKK